MKGIAILMVVIGHIGQAIPGLRVFTPLGAIGVGIFLICSGYGIEKSYTKNGRDKYWYKRIVNVWLPYAIVEILALPLHWGMGWQAILKDFTFVQPLNPFGWYMQFLFIWYILYYVTTFANKYKLPLMVLAGFIIWLTGDSLHAQNAFSFAIGVALAQMKSIGNLWKKKYLLIALSMSLVCFFVRDYVKLHHHNINLLWNGVSLSYYLALIFSVVIGYKLLSNHKVWLPYNGLIVVGVYSYELYLLHGYAYKVLAAPAIILMVTEFAAICIVCTYILHKFNNIILNLIKNKISR